MKHIFYQLGVGSKCRIALIADTHGTSCDRLLVEIKRCHPDLIIIAGDIVYGTQLDRKGFTYDPSTPMLTRFPNADRLI